MSLLAGFLFKLHPAAEPEQYPGHGSLEQPDEHRQKPTGIQLIQPNDRHRHQRSLRQAGSHGGATGMGNSAAEKDRGNDPGNVHQLYEGVPDHRCATDSREI